jgi:hypothetical protein
MKRPGRIDAEELDLIGQGPHGVLQFSNGGLDITVLEVT